MKRLIPIFALLFAVSAAAYFIYLAQSNAPRGSLMGQTPGTSTPARLPASGTTGAPASQAPESTAPASSKSEPAKKPVFQSGSKAFAPSDGRIMQGGSKALAPGPLTNVFGNGTGEDGEPMFQGGSKSGMIGVGHTLGAGQGVGRIQGMGRINPASAASKAPASEAPNSDVPAQNAPNRAPNAPPTFMGGSKYDPGALPLPKRPQTP